MATVEEQLADPIVCPRCACPQFVITNKSVRWGRPITTRCCAACARTWTAIGGEPAPEPRRRRPQAQALAQPHPDQADAIARTRHDPPQAIDYFILRCPVCRSRDIPVMHTSAPIRYHRCRGCCATFKSIEVEVDARRPAA